MSGTAMLLSLNRRTRDAMRVRMKVSDYAQLTGKFHFNRADMLFVAEYILPVSFLRLDILSDEYSNNRIRAVASR